MTDNDNNVVPIGSATKNKDHAKPLGVAPERPLFPSPDAPLDVARRLYKAFRAPAGPTLVCHRGDWMRWRDQQWSDWDAAHLRSTVYRRLGEVDYEKPIRKSGEIDHYERTRWNPNRHKVANVLEALAAVAHLAADIDAPAWIGDHDTDSPADQMIACTNGLLSLSDRQLHKHTPAFYNHVSVPFAYDADAPQPTAWLEFLRSLWPDDPASVELLQQWIGYIVTGRTDMQKILLLIGPTRSGKGTIARMIRNLIGRGRVTGPTLASLGTNFGLAPLMGKPLAIIADARLGGSPIHTIVERLLSISGEDVLTVDRKFRDPWSGKLPTRLMILSNEVPRFSDASGAIANRLLVLQMRNSFLGREDRTLDARITDELPGILNWALEGLDRLAENGRFTVPKSSGEATTMLMDLASPVSAFVRDCCTRGQDHRVERDRLYAAWKLWCVDAGHEHGSKATFGRNLAAVVPDLGTARPRVGGTPIRYYTHIGLAPGSPGSDLIPAGRSIKDDPGDPGSSSEAIPAGQADINAVDPGDPRKSALSSVPQNKKKPELPATDWMAAHIAALRADGRTLASSREVYAAGQAVGYTINSLRAAASVNPDIRRVASDGRGATWSITPTEVTA
ncbi:hypothetical protein A5715_00625 [Mycolicibacter heraklionensis]|nr:hypothetical protein A5715_00625 [Mycolicibacter heraklionensis]